MEIKKNDRKYLRYVHRQPRRRLKRQDENILPKLNKNKFNKTRNPSWKAVTYHDYNITTSRRICRKGKKKYSQEKNKDYSSVVKNYRK